MQQTPPQENSFSAREAFSLIEMFIVFGIIIVLAGIVVPSVAVLREKGKELACANNMRQWGTAMGMYLDEHRGVFPKDGVSGEETSAWYNVLPQYIGIEPFYALKAKGKAPCSGMGKSIYICPALPDDTTLLAAYASGTQTTYDFSYAMNYWINAPKEVDWLSTRMRLSQVKYSDQFVVFSELLKRDLKSVDIDPVSGAITSSPDFRHRGRVNVVFADGHVAPVRRLDAGNLQWNPHFEPGQAPKPKSSDKE